MSESYVPLNQESGYLDPAELEHLIDNAPKCHAGKSACHGYGLIASVPISMGEAIIDFSDPEIYKERLFSELEPWRLQGGKYTGLSEEKCLISEEFTKYSLLNHSRQANAVWDLENRWVVAARNIEPGEEVTVDYRLEPVSPEARAYIEHFL